MTTHRPGRRHAAAGRVERRRVGDQPIDRRARRRRAVAVPAADAAGGAGVLLAVRRPADAAAVVADRPSRQRRRWPRRSREDRGEHAAGFLRRPCCSRPSDQPFRRSRRSRRASASSANARSPSTRPLRWRWRTILTSPSRGASIEQATNEIAAAQGVFDPLLSTRLSLQRQVTPVSSLIGGSASGSLTQQGLAFGPGSAGQAVGIRHAVPGRLQLTAPDDRQPVRDAEPAVSERPGPQHHAAAVPGPRHRQRSPAAHAGEAESGDVGRAVQTGRDGPGAADRAGVRGSVLRRADSCDPARSAPARARPGREQSTARGPGHGGADRCAGGRDAGGDVRAGRDRRAGAGRTRGEHAEDADPSRPVVAVMVDRVAADHDVRPRIADRIGRGCGSPWRSRTGPS